MLPPYVRVANFASPRVSVERVLQTPALAAELARIEIAQPPTTNNS